MSTTTAQEQHDKGCHAWFGGPCSCWLRYQTDDQRERHDRLLVAPRHELVREIERLDAALSEEGK